MKKYSHCSLLEYNTFGINHQCDELVIYANADDARTLAMEMGKTGYADPMLILGGGSNLLLTRDFQGRVVTAEKRFEVCASPVAGDAEKVDLRCWAGSCFDEVVAYAVAHDYHGLENLSLIPGECGASAVQNIGAYGVEAKDVIVEIEAVSIESGELVKIKADDCGYGYRQSKFKQEWRNKYLLTYVTYRLSRIFRPHLEYGNIKETLSRKMIGQDQITADILRETIIEIRQAKLPDPRTMGNAGSFFMNPMVDSQTLHELKAHFPDIRYFEVTESAHDETGMDGEEKKQRYKIPAGWMIDQCGWKGRKLGRAGVYEKQALVLVNLGGATGAEIVTLMKQIQADVYDRFGIQITPEVNII